MLKDLPGKYIMVGAIDLVRHDGRVRLETVAARIRRALEHMPADKVIVAPDCGMKYLPHDVAFGKMQAMVEGARILRDEYTA